jgi:hypothetical protein
LLLLHILDDAVDRICKLSLLVDERTYLELERVNAFPIGLLVQQLVPAQLVNLSTDSVEVPLTLFKGLHAGHFLL